MTEQAVSLIVTARVKLIYDPAIETLESKVMSTEEWEDWDLLSAHDEHDINRVILRG